MSVDVHRVDAAGNAAAKCAPAKHQEKADKPTLASKLTIDDGEAGELAEVALNLNRDLWPDQRIRRVTALCRNDHSSAETGHYHRLLLVHLRLLLVLHLLLLIRLILRWLHHHGLLLHHGLLHHWLLHHWLLVHVWIHHLLFRGLAKSERFLAD